MKKKLLFGIGVLLLIGGLIYGALPSGFIEANIPKITQPKPNAQDYTYIDSIISTPVKENGVVKHMTEVTFTTEWNSLGFNFLNPKNLVGKSNTDKLALMEAALNKEFTKEKLINALTSESAIGTDEVTADITSPYKIFKDPIAGLSYGDSYKANALMHEYFVENKVASDVYRKNLKSIMHNPNSSFLSDMSVETKTSGEEYDYIFVIETSHIGELMNGDKNIDVYKNAIKNQLKKFAGDYISKDDKFQGTIIEFGGGILESPKVGTLVSGNTYKKNGITPTVTYSDKNDNGYLFLKKYDDWLDNKEMEKALETFGEDIVQGATYGGAGTDGANDSIGNGPNGPRALYEAINFAKKATKKETNRKKAIILVGQTNWHFGTAQLAPFGGTKEKFVSWLKTNLGDDTVIMGSLSLGEQDVNINDNTTFPFSPKYPLYNIKGNTDREPDPRPQVDRLNQDVTDSRNASAQKQFFPPNLKYILGDKFIEYQGSTFGPENFQIYLGGNLEHFAGSGVIRQKWKMKFESPITKNDVWKKLIFSVGNIKIENNSITVNPKTRLMNPSTESGIPEYFADRYYYQNKNFPVVTFNNPNEVGDPRKWIKEENKSWTLDFNLHYSENKTINDASIREMIVVIGKDAVSIPFGSAIKDDEIKTTRNFKVPIEESIINRIRDLMKNATPEGGEPPPITFKVKGLVDGNPTEGSVTAKADLVAPEVKRFVIENITARKILKDQLKLKDLIGDKEIDNLTSADKNGTLYVRESKSKDQEIRIKFSLYDENFILGTDKKPDVDLYKQKVKTSLENDFTGVLFTEEPVYNTTAKTIDFVVTGKPKDGKNFTPTLKGIKDSYGNEIDDSLSLTKVGLLADPVANDITAKPDSVDTSLQTYYDEKEKNEVTLPIVQTHGNSKYEYNLVLSKISDFVVKNQIVAIIVPFKQDKTKTNAIHKTQSLNYGTNIVDNVLSFKVFEGASDYPKSVGGAITPLNKNTLEVKTDEKITDGVYTVNKALQVNRAGGITGSIDGTDIAANLNTTSIKDTLKDDVTGATKYVVDTIPPEVKEVYKTGVTFRNDSKPYPKDYFYYDTLDDKIKLSDSIELPYKSSNFTGKDLKGKEKDTYTIAINDFSLILKNSEAGVSGNTNNIATAKFYTFDIGSNGVFTAKDLAGNINNLPEKQIIITETKPSHIIYGVGAKDLLEYKDETKARFTNSLTDIFDIPSDAISIATSIGKVKVSEKEAFKVYGKAEAKNAVNLSGSPRYVPDLITYSISDAGWVRELIKPIVWDNDVNDNNPKLPTTVTKLSGNIYISKNGTGNTYSGNLDLSGISEYAGLESITFTNSNKGTIDSSYNKSLNTIPSITIKPTGATGKTIPFSVVYSASIPIKDSINFTLVDNLGNSRNFSMGVTLINNIKIIGASKNEKKIIESKVSNGAKVNIKATKQNTK